MGLEPACVVVCPVEAILVGDVNDPSSRVSKIVNRGPVAVRRPEKDTKPKVFYKGAHQATLDPIAARRPQGDTYMWSQRQPEMASQQVESGHPGAWSNSSAAALLSYDVPHTAPWDWRVSLYTWTKSIAAGIYLVPLLLILFGSLTWSSGLFRWAVPVLGGLFLAATGGLLVWDLSHPARFYMIFTRPQPKSWLTKGAFVITGYGAVLAAHFGAALASSEGALAVLAIAGLPLSVMTAVYTAYLFAQSKARDLWQSGLLPAHMFVQMVLAGAATALLAGALLGGGGEAVRWVCAGAALAHLLLVWGETTLEHPTAHARLALWEMTRGRFSPYFWAGAVMVAIALLAPLIGVAAAPFALAGLLAHEHAYVQAAQAVPLA
jgi:formate-dependent nitrite reductase membrane component NrfD